MKETSQSSEPSIPGESSVFVVGARVQVAALRKSGVIHEFLSHGKVRIEAGTSSIVCHISQLTPALPQKIHTSTSIKIGRPKAKHQFFAIDLHGHRTDEAIRKLEILLDQALLAGADRIKVIHGFGSGKVQKAVHQYLATMRCVENFKLNPLNAGETDVFL